MRLGSERGVAGPRRGLGAGAEDVVEESLGGERVALFCAGPAFQTRWFK